MLVKIDGKNKHYEQAKFSLRSAIDRLKDAKRQLEKAYEEPVDHLDDLIDDANGWLIQLQKEHN